MLAATNIKKILPSIGIELVGADDNDSPTPISAGGIDQRSGGIDIRSLSQMEAKNII